MNKENFEINNRENLAKTRYFSDFALKHFSEMKILKKGGILGKENKDWRNISEHCLVEAVGADILAEHLGADREMVVEAVLLHDWYKRKEIEEMKSKGAIWGHQQAAGEDENLLRGLNISEEIIKLAHSNILENTDDNYINNRSIEEKIFHLMDVRTSGSVFVNYEERLRTIEQRGNKNDIAFSESFRDKYNGKSLFEVQKEVAIKEQQEFEKKLNIQEGTLIDFIKEKLEERINNF